MGRTGSGFAIPVSRFRSGSHLYGQTCNQRHMADTCYRYSLDTGTARNNCLDLVSIHETARGTRWLSEGEKEHMSLRVFWQFVRLRMKERMEYRAAYLLQIV